MKSYFSINIYIALYTSFIHIYKYKQQYGINLIMLESERDRHFNILQSDHVCLQKHLIQPIYIYYQKYLLKH
jgi:hypothetical protein